MGINADIIELYGGAFLNLVCLGLWYAFVFKEKPRSFIRALLFPFYHARNIIGFQDDFTAYFIFYCYVRALDSILAVLIYQVPPYILLTEWSLFIILDTFFAVVYFLKLKSIRFILICFLLNLAYVMLASRMSARAQSLQVFNAFAFALGIVVFFIYIYLLFQIIREERFVENMDLFFIFFGFIIYNFLQSLSTIVDAFNWTKYANFAFYSTDIGFLFWTLSVPWMRHLRSKLT